MDAACVHDKGARHPTRVVVEERRAALSHPHMLERVVRAVVAECEASEASGVRGPIDVCSRSDGPAAVEREEELRLAWFGFGLGFGLGLGLGLGFGFGLRLGSGFGFGFGLGLGLGTLLTLTLTLTLTWYEQSRGLAA